MTDTKAFSCLSKASEVVETLDPLLGAFGVVVKLVRQILETRPQVHQERVQRLKERTSVLEEQLRAAAGSASDSAHLQQTRSRLEKVLEDALALMRKLENVGWIKRFISKGSVDGDFDDLNQRLSQECLSLVLSLNIDARAMQQTFNEERRRAEDEKDRATDMKFLEEMKDTLLAVKDDTYEIKGIVKETKYMVKEIKAGGVPEATPQVQDQGPPPAYPAADAPPISQPVKQAPPHIQATVATQALQQAPAYTKAPPPVQNLQQAPPQAHQQAPPYSQAPPQAHQQAPPYAQAPPQAHQQAPPYAQAPPQAHQQAPPYSQAPAQMVQGGHMIQVAPQQMQMAQQPVQVLICSGDLGDVPTMTTCRNCGQRVQTRVVYHSGAFAWLICGLCIIFGLVFGCCVLPFFMDSCKDAHHFCSNCNVNLCIHKKM